MRILVDTNIWVHHFRRADPMLGMLLEEDFVLCHPIVIGELSMGDLKERRSLLLHLSRLNRPRTATWRETREFVKKRELYGRGV